MPRTNQPPSSGVAHITRRQALAGGAASVLAGLAAGVVGRGSDGHMTAPMELLAASSATLGLEDGPFELVKASAQPFPVIDGLSYVGAIDGAGLDRGLYLFASAGTGDLAGIWRWRPDTGLTFLGIPRSNRGADFNGLGPWGAPFYKGKLWVGDRRAGKLRRLDINPDGTLGDLVDAATIGGEDVFPGVGWMGFLWCGTFGVGGAHPLNPELWRWDGKTALRVIDFSNMGSGGAVFSMTRFQTDLYVSVVDKYSTQCEVWKLTEQLQSSRVWAGASPRLLCNDGTDLYSLRVERPDYDHLYWDVWTGSSFQPISAEIAIVGTASVRGAMVIGQSLVALVSQTGVIEYQNGQVSIWSPTPSSTGPYPWSAIEYGGYLWVTSAYFVSLWRRQLGVARVFQRMARPR